MIRSWSLIGKNEPTRTVFLRKADQKFNVYNEINCFRYIVYKIFAMKYILNFNLLVIVLLFNSMCIQAQESNIIKTDLGDIHYIIIGEGDPVLIINGGPGFNCEGFLPMATQIADMGYQTILYDQRGTGKSKIASKDESTVTLDFMIADIEEIRKNLELKEWNILGHSFGGMLANYYASKFPERVKSMIASSSGGMDLSLLHNTRSNIRSKLTSVERDSLDYWQSQLNSGNRVDHARIRRAKYMAAAYVYHDEHVPVVAKRLTQGDMNLNRIVWSDMRSKNFDCKQALSNFTAPVLIIQGADDILDMQVAEVAHETLMNSSLVKLKNCGHYGWLDAPDQYFRVIHNFLKEL